MHCVRGQTERRVHLTAADEAGLVGAREPLTVAIDATVVGAAIAHSATGA